MLLFWNTTKKSFADAYDYLGLTILSSSIYTGVILVFLTLMRLTPYYKSLLFLSAGIFVLYTFLLSPIIAGAASISKKIILKDDLSAKDLFADMRLHLFSAWKLAFLQSCITILILLNIWFYFTHGGVAFKIISVFFLYLFLFWLASAIYHFPIMIEQKTGACLTVKRGFLLELDNFIFTALLFFVIILFACICIVTFAGLAFIYLGVLSMLSTRMTRVLFMKYDLIPPDEEPKIIDNGFPPIS